MRLGVALLTAALLGIAPGVALTEETSQSAVVRAQLRRPVAGALLAQDELLAVANQRSGTVSLLDARQFQVVGEFAIGRQLADLVAVGDGRHLLALDSQAHELILLEHAAGQLRVATRLPVSRHPVSVAVDLAAGRCYVGALWSHQLDVIEIARATSDSESPRLRKLNSLPLPFAPRRQLVLSAESKLLVADAFGGGLALVDLNSGALAGSITLRGHNIRGLALSDDRRQLVVAHQILEPTAPTTGEYIRNGLLMANVVQWLSLAPLLQPSDPAIDSQGVFPLGQVGYGAADPSDLVAIGGDRFLVPLGGSNEVALVDGNGSVLRRFAVSQRPTAVVVRSSEPRAFVLNTLGDSVSVIDLTAEQVVREIALGPAVELAAADRGEVLFYDAGLSADRWMSCHSCHTDGHSNGMLADTQGDASYGTPKRVLTLLGTRNTDPWAWNGHIKELHEQVQQSVQSTMRGRTLSPSQINDLVAFLHTFDPPPPRRPASADDPQRDALERGRASFHRRGCVRCHVPPLTYSTNGVFPIGLTDETGNDRFNPPSLRGVSQQSGYFHDRRAESLEEVFSVYGHQIEGNLSAEELRDLVRFLESL